MFKWLMGLPNWFQIMFSIFLIVAVIVLIIVAIKKGISIKAKGKIFNIGGIKDEAPHKNCPFSKDVVTLLNSTQKIIQEKQFIIYVQQIRDQMNFAEQKLDQIRNLLHRSYLKKLEKKEITDLVSSNSFCSYRSVLLEVQNTMLTHMRHYFKENHFNDLSELGFSNYIENKIEFLKNESTNLLNQFYFYKKDISREELYVLNKEIEGKISELFKEIFIMARILSIENDLKLQEYDNKLQRLIDTYI
jgi:hypothetical protein